MTDTWWNTVPALLIAWAVLVTPGAPLAAALRLRGPAFLAISVASSVTVVATTAIIAELIRVPFGPEPVVTGTLVGTFLCYVIGRLTTPRTGDPRRRSVLAVGVAALVSSIIVAAVAFHDVPSPELVSQTYDGTFHLNAAAQILADGQGSSLTLYRLNHPGGGLQFYPGAWHDLVALVATLSGASVPVATNAVWIVTAGFGTAVGVGFLAQALFPTMWRRGIAWIAASLIGLSAAGPYLLLQWGTLYPTGLAMALLPTGLALAVLMLRRRGGPQHAWGLITPAVVWTIGAALAHPRTLPTLALLAMPLLLSRAGSLAAPGLRDPSRRRRTLVVVFGSLASLVAIGVVGVFGVLRYFGAEQRPISDRLNGGPATARQTIGDSVLQAVFLSPPLGPTEIAATASIAMAVLVIGGLAAITLHRGNRWIVVSYIAVVALYALAAGSNDDIAKLATGLWYKDKYRLFAALGPIVPVAAAYAVTVIVGAVTRMRPVTARLFRLLTLSLVATVIALGVFSPGSADVSRAVGQIFRLDVQKNGALLDRDTFDLLRALPNYVPAGTRVVGNPWNGSSLSGPLGQREALFPHFTGDWDADRSKVRAAMQWVASDSTVCEALDRLEAHYFFTSPGLMWNGDPQAVAFEGLDRAVGAPGLTEVARRGDAVLYRISACD